MATASLGLLGGTFDPVHYGHLRLGAEVKRALGLGEMRLLPAGDPPHRAAPFATAAQRVTMLELALEEFPELELDTREIARKGRSYTVLTLDELRAESADRPLALILGADAFLGLPAWHRWMDLLRLAHLVVVARPDVRLDERMPPALDALWHAHLTDDAHALSQTPAGCIYRQAVTPHAISASAIRDAAAQGHDGIAQVRGLLPAAVLAYIERNQLYRPRPDAT